LVFLHALHNLHLPVCDMFKHVQTTEDSDGVNEYTVTHLQTGIYVFCSVLHFTAHAMPCRQQERARHHNRWWSGESHDRRQGVNGSVITSTLDHSLRRRMMVHLSLSYLDYVIGFGTVLSQPIELLRRCYHHHCRYDSSRAQT
jgi:hypothetical protein